MVAGLLYVVGLVATIATAVMVGFSAPELFDSFNAELGSPTGGLVSALLGTARQLEWAVLPFAGGLAAMALGRIVILLGSIDRALRGNP
jgi:hypothetical protein